MDESSVPAHPVAEIDVSADAVTVDGVVVDRGSAGLPDTTLAMNLGVLAAARRVAQPLGRPVRAILRSGTEEKRLVIHPDGSVTDVEDTFPVVSLVARAGARAIPISGHARRPVRAARIRAALRVNRTKPAVWAAYVALGAVLAGGLLMEAFGGGEPAPVATGPRERPPAEAAIAEPAAPAVQAVGGSRLERLPGIRDVVATPDTGGFRLRITTSRAVRVTVLASSRSGDGPARLWTIGAARATTRTLEVDDLPAGAYRWVVRAPGEGSITGVVVVRPVPEPPSVLVVSNPTPQVPAPTQDDRPPPHGNGADDDGGGGDDDDDERIRLQGPTQPVDPDDPHAR